MKILIIKNNYTGKIKIDKYLKWFKDNGICDIEYDVIETKIPVVSKKVGNSSFKGVIADPAHIIPELKKIVPEFKYHTVVMYNDKLDGIRVSWASGEFYPDTEFIQLAKIVDDGKTLNHEIWHTLVYRAKKRQYPVQDVMDTYSMNDNFNLKDNTNRSRQLKILKPYLDKIFDFRNMKYATLTRQKSDKFQTLGELECVNGSRIFKCKTLELPWLNNQNNISCVPTGTYLVKPRYSLKFGKVYELQNVKNRTYIYIHQGNYYTDIKGCILVGDRFSDINKDGKLDVINSKITRNTLESFFGFEEFTLFIK